MGRCGPGDHKRLACCATCAVGNSVLSIAVAARGDRVGRHERLSLQRTRDRPTTVCRRLRAREDRISTPTTGSVMISHTARQVRTPSDSGAAPSQPWHPRRSRVRVSAPPAAATPTRAAGHHGGADDALTTALARGTPRGPWFLTKAIRRRVRALRYFR